MLLKQVTSIAQKREKKTEEEEKKSMGQARQHIRLQKTGTTNKNPL